MVQGVFASIRHRHSFEAAGTSTLMRDEFDFTAPLGVLGRIAECLFLKSYMTRFLEARNIAMVHARVAATIQSIFVEEGDYVVAGKTKLFQIEERTVGDGPSKSVYLKDKRKK